LNIEFDIITDDARICSLLTPDAGAIQTPITSANSS
jgi:hypothetical protein